MATLPDQNDQGELAKAESLVRRARLLSAGLFRAAHRMPEYKQVLATRERCQQFEDKLLVRAQCIDMRLNTRLPDDVLKDVVIRLAGRITTWDHSPTRQQGRQKLQVAKRRRRNRGRDLRIVRLHENGESQRRIAARLGISRGAVRNVLRRDLSPERPEE